MTIVDLADLDTFIRDSLFEVRRGIANSRNATQANPMLGVMVDLPEKIDFEIVVTSDYQSKSLDRTSSSIESRKDVDNAVSISSTNDSSKDNQTSLSNEQTTESAQGYGSDTDSKGGGGAEKESKGGTGSDTDTKGGAGKEGDSKKGTGIEGDSKSGSGAEKDSQSGGGTETDSKGGSGTETDKNGGTGTEKDSKSGSGTKSDKNNSLQVEVHSEANDRASKTFDEEEGSWGGQGQISTPKLPGNPCKCGS